MKLHVKQALACTTATFVAAIAFLYAALGAPASDAGAAEAIGRLFAMTAIAGILCAWMARRSSPPWSWAKFAGIHALVCVVLLFLASQGRAAHAQPAAGAPFAVTWPKGWTVQHLHGLSSAPADRDLGWRERGLLGDAKAPGAVIEISCVDAHEDREAIARQFDAILAGSRHGYEAQGFAVTTTKAEPANIGAHAGLTAVLVAARDEMTLLQDFSIAQHPRCLLTATFTARKAEYYANLAAYTAVKASLR